MSLNFLQSARSAAASLSDLLVRSPPPVAEIRARLLDPATPPIQDLRVVAGLLRLHDPEVTAQVLRRRQQGTDSWPFEGNIAPPGLSSPNPAHVLHLVAREGAVDWIDWIVSQDSHAIHALDVYGHTPLYTRHAGALQRLLDVPHVDINAADTIGETPLHYVCTGQVNAECVRTLIEHGADVDLQQKYGMTPLHKVLYSYLLLHANPAIPFQEVIRTLLLAGSTFSVEDSNDMTARDLAARHPSLLAWFNAIVPAADQIAAVVPLTTQESGALRLMAERAVAPPRRQAPRALRAPPLTAPSLGSFASLPAASLSSASLPAASLAPASSFGSFASRASPLAPAPSSVPPFSFASPAASFASSFATRASPLAPASSASSFATPASSAASFSSLPPAPSAASFSSLPPASAADPSLLSMANQTRNQSTTRNRPMNRSPPTQGGQGRSPRGKRRSSRRRKLTRRRR